jgi:hypothetical protein
MISVESVGADTTLNKAVRVFGDKGYTACRTKVRFFRILIKFLSRNHRLIVLTKPFNITDHTIITNLGVILPDERRIFVVGGAELSGHQK